VVEVVAPLQTRPQVIEMVRMVDLVVAALARIRM
jgi:hypothetical protein